MDKFNLNSVIVDGDPLSPNFSEQWLRGTYLVSGVFPIQKSGLTIRDIIEQIPALYDETISHKRAIWPRGICGYFLVPIYISDSFDELVQNWVRSYHRYRWAIWHEPLLYNKHDNVVYMRSDYGTHGAAFRPYLAKIIGSALTTITHKYHMSFPRKKNGDALQIG